MIILDKHLRGEDGLELIHQLRALTPGSFPPIYLVTADIYCQTDRLDQTLGIAAVLHKPLQFHDLRKALRPSAGPDCRNDEFSELRTQLQEILRRQLPSDFKRLLEHYGSGDLKQSSLLVHRIQGAAANAGLHDIEEACKTIEQKLITVDGEDCSNTIQELSNSIAILSSS